MVVLVGYNSYRNTYKSRRWWWCSSWDPNSGNCGGSGGAGPNTSGGQGNFVAHTSTPVTNQGFPGGYCPGPIAIHGGGGGGGAGVAGTASSGDGSGGVTGGPGGAGKQLPGFPMLS